MLNLHVQNATFHITVIQGEVLSGIHENALIRIQLAIRLCHFGNNDDSLFWTRVDR